MDNCDDCTLASGGVVHPLEWNRFNPACMDCGARMVCFIRRMKVLSTVQRSQRMSKVVDDWVAWGHDEAALRERCARTWSEWGAWANERARHRPRP